MHWSHQKLVFLIELYFFFQAIELAPEGPSSHIYYCNRAAARSHMGLHEEGQFQVGFNQFMANG